jgi:hypothetical protein
MRRRGVLLAGAGLVAARAARAQEMPRAAMIEALLGEGIEPATVTLATATWRPAGAPAGILAAAAVETGDERLHVALLRRHEDGKPEYVAGPAQVDALLVEPFRSPGLRILPAGPLLGAAMPAVAVRVGNRHGAAGRDTATEAVHLFLRHGPDALVQVLAVMTRLVHSEGGRVRERTELELRAAGGPARPDALPDLELRDLRTGAVAARHAWRDGAYRPEPAR